MCDVDVCDWILVGVKRGSRSWLEIEIVDDCAENRFHLHVGKGFPGAVLLTVWKWHEDTSIKDDVVFADCFSIRQHVRLLVQPAIGPESIGEGREVSGIAMHCIETGGHLGTFWNIAVQRVKYRCEQERRMWRKPDLRLTAKRSSCRLTPIPLGAEGRQAMRGTHAWPRYCRNKPEIISLQCNCVERSE